jgi:hypothetical protein
MPREDLWTKEETAQARKLIEAGAKNEVFLEKLCRSRDAAISRIKYLDDHAFRERTKQRAQKSRAGKGRIDHYVRSRAPVPEHVLDDARRRIEAPRTITSSFFGDPAPGQSALDKRNASSVRA